MFMHLTNSVILFCATFSFFTSFASYLGSFIYRHTTIWDWLKFIKRVNLCRWSKLNNLLSVNDCRPHTNVFLKMKFINYCLILNINLELLVG